MIAPGTLRLNHVAVPARDIDRSARFYQALGLVPGFRKPGPDGQVILQQMGDGAGFVELILTDRPDLAPGRHLGLRADRLGPVIDALAAQGIAPTEPARRGISGVAFVFFQDPSGNLVEITAPAE